ncbi:MAG TPA: dienelactone hydrolase family protein [Gemmatimonadaceae bacterium]|nr:dienelactone hydrolase family protein [Gemmatimonadaceae bacterium]
MSAGTADAYLYTHEDGKPRPGIIQLTDIHGLRPAARDMARRLAEEGYTVLLPNVFYRTRKPPMFDFPANFAEERTKQRFAELVGPLTPEAMAADGASYVKFLRAGMRVAPGPMGVVGYCFTGQMALRIAAARPDDIAAMASFHGGGLHTDTPQSPDLELPKVKAQLHFGHAFEDRSMPADAIAKLDHSLAAWGGRYESLVYDQARHGWTVPDSAAYNRDEAERAYGNLMALLARTLRV